MEPRTIALGTGAILFVTLISWALAHVAKYLPERIPRLARIVVCGTAVQIALLWLGFMTLEDESFVVWALSRPARTYFLVPGALLLGCLAAWSVLRKPRQNLDIRTFD